MARVRQIVRHLQAHECVSLIGPSFSEKSRLLDDVAEVLAATGLYRSLYLDLWDTQSDDEAAFFSSLAGLIQRFGSARSPDWTSPSACPAPAPSRIT